MATYEDAHNLLAKAVAVCIRFEQLILGAHQRKPAGAVAYLTLVAERRLGASVAALKEEQAYEGRVLLRAMLEHYFNLAWILNRSPHRRANRFIKWLNLEKLRILESLPTAEQKDYRPTIARLRKRRTTYRRLFRITDRRGRRVWSHSWSPVSLAARVEEVCAAAPHATGTRSFIYTLYKWLSSATHGNVLYLINLVEPTRYGIRPRAQPDSDPKSITAGAAMLLIGSIQEAGRVLTFSQSMKDELSELQEGSRAYIASYPAE